MNRPALLILAAFLLAPSADLGASEKSEPNGKPNIVVILSDDYGYGSAGCYGANPALVKTTTISRPRTKPPIPRGAEGQDGFSIWMRLGGKTSG